MLRTNHFRIGICCVGIMCWLAAAPAMAAKSGIVGQWSIVVQEGKDKYPSWLGVQDKEGKPTAQFLGRWGGVGNTDSFSFENDTVSFKAQGREWTGKLDGDTIEGSWKTGDTQGKWTAHRIIHKLDVSGTWDVKVGDKKATLKLVQKGNAITGKWSEGLLKNTNISKAGLAGNTLSFEVGTKKVSAQIKGDALDGKSDADILAGQRERKWGKPIKLLDGNPADLGNWEPLEKERSLQWKIVDGVLTNGKNGTENIVTKRKDFWNFKLHVEFKVPEHGNSGVYLRGRHEIQVGDSFGHDPNPSSCGALYSRIAPKVNAAKKAGEWQTYDITLIDGYLTVVHNGQTIIDNREMGGSTGGAIDSNEVAPGPIYLQGDHSLAWYRKIILTPAE